MNDEQLMKYIVKYINTNTETEQHKYKDRISKIVDTAIQQIDKSMLLKKIEKFKNRKVREVQNEYDGKKFKGKLISEYEDNYLQKNRFLLTKKEQNELEKSNIITQCWLDIIVYSNFSFNSF